MMMGMQQGGPGMMMGMPQGGPGVMGMPQGGMMGMQQQQQFQSEMGPGSKLQ